MIHPNIISVKELFVRQHPPNILFNSKIDIKDVYVVMECMDADLRSVVKEHMELSQRQVKTLMFHICQGLS